VIPGGEFPEPFLFEPNIEYVRQALKMVDFTAEKEAFKPVNMLPKDYDFFVYQKAVNANVDAVPSIKRYRPLQSPAGQGFIGGETAPSPIPALQNRTIDNTTLGRIYQ
jgi:hypothetical protein